MIEIAITVDTSICSFEVAAQHAIELSAKYRVVEFRHALVSVEANPDWTVEQLRSVWEYERQKRSRQRSESERGNY